MRARYIVKHVPFAGLGSGPIGPRIYEEDSPALAAVARYCALVQPKPVDPITFEILPPFRLGEPNGDPRGWIKVAVRDDVPERLPAVFYVREKPYTGKEVLTRTGPAPR